MKTRGTGDGRELTVILDRKYTALGSQWLGKINKGPIDASVLTQCIYMGVYQPFQSRFIKDTPPSPKYYDANLNLVYDGYLNDLNQPGCFGPYIPESENEQIKDTLFKMVGWRTLSQKQTPETRWTKIYENEYYSTYIEKNTMETRGNAQNREMKAYFKRKYTPLGSQWLGENSNGRINPDTVTECIYYVFYWPTHSHLDDYTQKQPKYYDVNHRLIFNGPLEDMYGDTGFGQYNNKEENREIKATLYSLVGWNY